MISKLIALRVKIQHIIGFRFNNELYIFTAAALRSQRLIFFSLPLRGRQRETKSVSDELKVQKGIEVLTHHKTDG
jgi:hypothetical protein